MADDRPTVHTAPKTLLFTQRRGPASIAVAVVVVVAQLAKGHEIKDNFYQLAHTGSHPPTHLEQPRLSASENATLSKLTTLH